MCRSILQPDLPVVQGDRARLVEVVQNLVDNACKFMGDQAEPRITIGTQGTDRDGKPIVFVRDNGIGIDPPVSGEGVRPVRQTRSQVGGHGHRAGAGETHY